MSKLDYRNIEKVAGRCGGNAVVAGTRIRVSTILACYRQQWSVEEIVQQYPGLKPSDVHDALAYAYDHPEEIESDLLTVQDSDNGTPFSLTDEQKRELERRRKELQENPQLAIPWDEAVRQLRDEHA
jgi:putative addiction module component (TIGR02574 family)